MHDDDKESEDEPAEPAPDGARDEGADLREVSEEKLEQILAAHATWVQTERKEGTQADLSRCNLQKRSFQRANLRRANLQGAILNRADLQGARLGEANLQGANLFRANLQGANLFRANLQGAYLRSTTFDRLIATAGAEPTTDLEAADLSHADLRDADLSDARLSNVIGLLADKLAGANLSNAKLPEDIAKFEALDHVAEISRHARNNFLAVLGACVFSWLTIATTTDVALLTNRAETALPVIGTEVPIAGFYWAAPPILLALFLYLHLYLQRMWTGLATLPAVFPDGHTLDRRAYPWLLTSLVNAHVPLLRTRRPPFSRLMVFLSIVVAWLLVPATLGLFWLRYLPRHDWFWTSAQILFLALSIALAAAFYWRARATLRGHEPPDFVWRQAWKRTATFACGGLFLVSAAAGLTISLGAIEGDAPLESGKVDLRGPATWVPYAFDRMGYRSSLHLVGEELSVKPDNWTGQYNSLELSIQLRQIKPVRLRRINLRYALAMGAFLVGVDLTLVNLEGANLSGASLHAADLQGAILQSANLKGANLQWTNFKGADLRGADLTGANHLNREQLDEACGDEKTELSDYFADYEMKPCPEPE